MRQAWARNSVFRALELKKIGPGRNAGAGSSASSLPVRTASDDARWRRRIGAEMRGPMAQGASKLSPRDYPARRFQHAASDVMHLAQVGME